MRLCISIKEEVSDALREYIEDEFGSGARVRSAVIQAALTEFLSARGRQIKKSGKQIEGRQISFFDILEEDQHGE
jgi:Arc/MetJ-type ribon-helix-helix transcriptional regulator